MPPGGSKARLRTRTGCSTCRTRKKKCDEVKPICGRCSAASLPCSWQELAPDGRQKHHSKATEGLLSSPETSNSDVSKFSPHAADSWFMPYHLDTGLDDFELRGFMDLMTDWAPAIKTPSLEVGADEWLFEFWCEQWLPSLLHKHSSAIYCDFSYMRSMALDHKPLMETALACAALSQFYKGANDPPWRAKMRDKGLSHHTTAVACLRDAILNGQIAGTEDWVLATITGLTIFDFRDPKAPPPQSKTHVQAALQLFNTRETYKLERGGDTNLDEAHLVFERIHYEYLIYHCIVMMGFASDTSFDNLVGNSIWIKIESYFNTSPLPTDNKADNWPVLGMPYKLFRLIIAISRLCWRLPLSAADLGIASAVWREMLQWSSHVDYKTNTSAATVFTLTAKILLQQILEHQTEELSLKTMNEADIEFCIQLISKIEVGTNFARSWVWPVAVMHSIVQNPEYKTITREKMRTVLEKSDGGGPGLITEDRIDLFLIVPGLAAVIAPEEPIGD